MDQIRQTMMQHEALFKEQVQALHKLYDIQKAAMQEIRGQVYSPAQVLAFRSESIILMKDRYHDSVLEGKTLGPVYEVSDAQKEEALALSLRPFCTFKELKCGSLWMEGIGVESLLIAQNKLERNFDLEKFPEDYDGGSESEIEVEPMKASSYQQTGIVGEISVVGACLAVDPWSFQPRCSGTDSRDHTIPGHRTDQRTSIDLAQKYLPVAQSLDASQNSAPASVNTRVEKPSSLQQELPVSMVWLKPVTLDKQATPGLDNCSETGQGSIDGGALFRSEGEEVPLCNQDGSRPSVGLGSTVPGSETEEIDRKSYSNDEPENVTSSNRTHVTRETNEGSERKPAFNEGSESMAAEILLSFGPRRSEMHEMDSDPTVTDKMWKLPERRHAKHCYNGPGICESLRWTKSVNRRRTVRRPR